MHAQRVREDGLDDVAVRDRHPDGAGAVLGLQRRVVPADRRHRPRLHGGQRLAAREHRLGRLGLHHRPQRLLGELLSGRPCHCP